MVIAERVTRGWLDHGQAETMHKRALEKDIEGYEPGWGIGFFDVCLGELSTDGYPDYSVLENEAFAYGLFSYCDQDGMSVLHRACFHNHTAVIEACLMMCPQACNTITLHEAEKAPGRTPLMCYLEGQLPVATDLQYELYETGKHLMARSHPVRIAHCGAGKMNDKSAWHLGAVGGNKTKLIKELLIFVGRGPVQPTVSRHA